MHFLGHPLSFMILYVWTRKNPDEATSLFGMRVQAFYLPWALLAFKLLVGNSIIPSFLGICAGHIYYFLHFIAPKAYGVSLIRTPVFLIEAFGDVPIQASRRGANSLPARPLAGHHWGGGNVLGAN